MPQASSFSLPLSPYLFLPTPRSLFRFLPLLRRAYARRRLFLARAAWLAAEMNRAAWPAPELTHMRHLSLPALVFPVVAHPREDDSVRPKNRDGSHGIN